MDKLESIIRQLWDMIPHDRKVVLKVVDIDPAGNTYDEVETQRSKQLRETIKTALGIEISEPIE